MKELIIQEIMPEPFCQRGKWIFYIILYFLALKFLFRGFMIFPLARYIGAYAIFVMVIPYIMIHFGKSVFETLGSIIAGRFWEPWL